MFRIKNGTLNGFAILALLMMVSSNIVGQTSTRVVDILWNATGQLIATVDYSGAVIVVDVTQKTVFISTNNGFGTRIAWDPTSPERLAVSTLTQGTTLFNVLSGGVEAQFDTDANTYSVSFSPDGRFLLTSHGTPGDGPLGKGSIHIVEIATGNDRAIYEEVQHRVTMARWSPDGNRIGGLNVGDVGEVVIWDANTGAVIQRLSEAKENTDSELGTYVTGSISSFDWSSDGEILALGAELNITFWDSVAYTHIVTSDYLFVIEDIDWRPTEPIVAVASGYDRQIQLVDVISGQIVKVIPTSFDVLAVSWSPNGLQLAFSGITNLVPQVVDVPSLVIPTHTPTPSEIFTPTFTPVPTETFTSTPTPVPAFPLLLTFLCSPDPANVRVWRVRNPNPDSVNFTWDVVGTTQTGNGTVSGGSADTPGEVTFQTTAVAGANTTRLFVGGTLNDTKASTPDTCPTSVPVLRLRLTSMCSTDPSVTRVWRVRNPNPTETTITWEVVGTQQRGSLTVPAAVATTQGEAFFETVAVSGPNTTRILLNGTQQDVKASGGG